MRIWEVQTTRAVEATAIVIIGTFISMALYKVLMLLKHTKCEAMVAENVRKTKCKKHVLLSYLHVCLYIMCNLKTSLTSSALTSMPLQMVLLYSIIVCESVF